VRQRADGATRWQLAARIRQFGFSNSVSADRIPRFVSRIGFSKAANAASEARNGTSRLETAGRRVRNGSIDKRIERLERRAGDACAMPGRLESGKSASDTVNAALERRTTRSLSRNGRSGIDDDRRELENGGANSELANQTSAKAIGLAQLRIAVPEWKFAACRFEIGDFNPSIT
jgi:hypothetical protein